MSGSGCKNEGPAVSANQVSGKVMLGNVPASGATVTFIGAGGKKAGALVDREGKYVVVDAPPGKVQVTVKSMAGAGPALPTPAQVKDAKAGPPGATSVTVPAKYGEPNNGLTYEVKGGKETYDIELKP